MYDTLFKFRISGHSNKARLGILNTIGWKLVGKVAYIWLLFPLSLKTNT